MVATAHRHYTRRAFGLAETEQLGGRPARLEGPSALQHLQLDRDRGAEQIGQPRARHRRCADNVPGDQLGRHLDLSNTNHHGHLSASSHRSASSLQEATATPTYTAPIDTDMDAPALGGAYPQSIVAMASYR
ncbi:hypothetical protein GCM10029978_064530 [Actinoallomurus acanthiterrae]